MKKTVGDIIKINSKKPGDIREMLNLKFDKKFDYQTIFNECMKAKKQLFGLPQLDIDNLCKIFSEVASKHPDKIYFKILQNTEEGTPIGFFYSTI